MTTFIRLRNFALATDRPVVPPRFAPGLSTTHGGVPTGDPDISPDQTYPWLAASVRSVHLTSSGYLPLRSVPELMGTQWNYTIKSHAQSIER
jgi:hypothetical protein